MKINISNNMIELKEDDISYQIFLRLNYFNKTIPLNVKKSLRENKDNIMTMIAQKENIKFTYDNNIDTTILNISSLNGKFSYSSKTHDFGYDGFESAFKYILTQDVKTYTEDTLKDVIKLFGEEKKVDTIITIEGIKVDLLHPETILLKEMPPEKKLLICREIKANQHKNETWNLINTVEMDAMKSIILEREDSLTYEYNITNKSDILSIKDNDNLLISMPAKYTATYGINIIKLLNDKIKVKYLFKGKPVSRESALGHIYFPDKFRGDEELSLKHFVAFGDTEGLIEFITNKLNNITKLQDRYFFLENAKQDLSELDPELIKYIDKLQEAYALTRKRFSDKEMSLDDKIKCNKDRNETEYDYPIHRNGN